jgi:hypothetical protein
MLDTSELNLRHLLDSRRYLVFAAGIGLIAVLITFFVVIPQVSAVQDLFTKRGQETTKVKNLQTKVIDLETMTSSPLMGQIYTVEKVLPSKKPLLEMLSSLNLSAREAQVAVTSIELTPGKISTESATINTNSGTAKKKVSATKSKVVDTLSVDMNVDGRVPQLNTFFELVEKRAPLSTITSISLKQKSNSAANPDGAVFTATITVSSHFFVQSVSSSVESSLPQLDDKQLVLLSELKSFLIPEEQIQREIQGGGLIDLFGAEQPLLEAAQ